MTPKPLFKVHWKATVLASLAAITLTICEALPSREGATSLITQIRKEIKEAAKAGEIRKENTDRELLSRLTQIDKDLQITNQTIGSLETKTKNLKKFIQDTKKQLEHEGDDISVNDAKQILQEGHSQLSQINAQSSSLRGTLTALNLELNVLEHAATRKTTAKVRAFLTIQGNALEALNEELDQAEQLTENLFSIK